MTEITAERVHFDHMDEVVPKGSCRIQTPPYVQLCIEDGRALGEAWSVFVDTVVYHRALFKAQGKTEAQTQKLIRALYLDGLAKLDIDEFEAEMYWETYLDTEWERENPYAFDEPGPVYEEEDDGPVEEIEVDDEDGLRAVQRRLERERSQ